MRLLRWPQFVLFVLVLGPYAYFCQGGDGNQASRFDLTRAIVEQHTSIIDRYASNTGDLSCRGPLGRCERARPEAGEHYYSDKAPGISWMGVLPYAAAYAAFPAAARSSYLFLLLSRWWITIFAVGVPSAIGVVMLYMGLEAFTHSEPVRIAIALAYGFATLAFPYSTSLYGHQTAAALLLIGFALLVRAKCLSAEPASAGLLGGVGSMLGYAVAIEYPSALAVLILVVYAATFVRPWWRLGWLAVGGAIAAIPLAMYHWLVFGGPLTPAYKFSTQTPRTLSFMGIGWPSLHVVLQILVSSYRGLFFSSPWMLMAVPGAIVLLVRRGRSIEALVCVMIAVLFIWLNSSLVDWDGGWAMGPRYLIPAIPFLAILVVGVVPRTGLRASNRGISMAGASLALALIAISGVLMLAGTGVGPDVSTDIHRPFADYLLPSFIRGELSNNAQNAGRLIGLNGLLSLVPICFYVVVAGGYLAWTIRRKRTVGAPELPCDSSQALHVATFVHQQPDAPDPSWVS